MSHISVRSPVQGEDVEIIQPPDPSHLRVHTFQLEPFNSTSPGARQSPEAPSPTSSDSSLFLDNGFPSESDIRRGNPEWVGRPRNSFFIFRCEYIPQIRKHTKEGKRVRRPPGTNPEKTLSKRAAEAWHQLSAEEKNHYKELAEQEKEEHARLYPNYRFRPVKRGMAQSKKPAPVSRSNSQPLIPSLATESVSEQELSITQPYRESPEPQPPVDIALVKAGRRRSASVPLLPTGGNHTFTSGEWGAAQSPRLRMKRSRSVLGNRPPSLSMSSMSSPYEGQSFDPRMLEVDPSSGYIAPEESFGAVQVTSEGTYIYPYQYDSAVDPNHLSSSWTGEIHTPEATTHWSSSPLTELQPLQCHGSFSEYNSVAADPPIDGIMANYMYEDQWASGSTEYSYSSVQTSGLDSSGTLFSPATSYNGDIAATPREYSQMVDAHAAVENPEEAMFALNINDYLHYGQ